jgi:hypothetical protein
MMQTSLSNPSLQPPWLLISPEHAPTIVRVIEYWRTVPSKKSTETLLSTRVRLSSKADTLAVLSSMDGVSPDFAILPEDKLKRDQEKAVEVGLRSIPLHIIG